jgi:hypothetical protein
MECKRDYCPCCGYPTLPLREHPQMPTFDICFLCYWQDDGQTDIDADRVYGGPNGKYSLTEARANFKKYLVMFSPENDTRIVPGDLPEEIYIKKSLINLFEEIKITANKDKKEAVWAEIVEMENKLHGYTHRKVERFTKK